MLQKLFFIFATALGALAVIVGAFGAHAFKDILANYGTAHTFETGSKYHFYHALALLLTAILMYKVNSVWIHYAGWTFLGGTIVFSGSLYILSLTGVTKWGAVAPVGGLLLIAGWVLLLIGLVRDSQQ